MSELYKQSGYEIVQEYSGKFKKRTVLAGRRLPRVVILSERDGEWWTTWVIAYGRKDWVEESRVCRHDGWVGLIQREGIP